MADPDLAKLKRENEADFAFVRELMLRMPALPIRIAEPKETEPKS